MIGDAHENASRDAHEDAAGDAHENVAAYSLDALSELEARAFERHLGECAECRADLALLRPAADALAEAPEPLEPSPRLKRELMRQVEEEARAGAPDAQADEPRGRGRARNRRGKTVRPLRLTAARRATAVAAVALAALAGVIGYGLGRGDEEGRTLAAQVDADRLTRGTAQLSVPGSDMAPAILRVRDLPLPGERRVYEAWVLRGGRVEPAAVFTVRADGSAEVPVSAELETADAVMVTREREGGAAAPTERPVMTVRLN